MSTMSVFGTGPLADAVRAEIARDPDRYRPETWSTMPSGNCPCCDSDVFRCTTRHTGWTEGFATHDNVVHPRMDPATCQPSQTGTVAGCCCVAPNWGPKHEAPRKPSLRRRKRAT